MSTFRFGKPRVTSLLSIVTDCADDRIVLAKILIDSLSDEQQQAIVDRYNEYIAASNRFYLDWESPTTMRGMLESYAAP